MRGAGGRPHPPDGPQWCEWTRRKKRVTKPIREVAEVAVSTLLQSLLQVDGDRSAYLVREVTIELRVFDVVEDMAEFFSNVQ
jgi:hypothetical protein